MFFIKTFLGKSDIDGIGLFAGEDIKRGALVYKPSPELDLELSNDQYQHLDHFSQEVISHYGYFGETDSKWHLAFDNIRFINHAEKANIRQEFIADERRLLASCNISKGEELTQNYRDLVSSREEIENF